MSGQPLARCIGGRHCTHVYGMCTATNAEYRDEVKVERVAEAMSKADYGAVLPSKMGDLATELERLWAGVNVPHTIADEVALIAFVSNNLDAIIAALKAAEQKSDAGGTFDPSPGGLEGYRNRPPPSASGTKAAELPDDVAGMGDRWLIRKNGYWYRPNCSGYTDSAISAGRYSLEDAERYSHPNGKDGPRDGMTIHHEDELTCPDWLAFKQQRDTIAALSRQLADMTEQRDLAISNFEHNHDEWLALKEQLAERDADNKRLREELRAIGEGDQYVRLGLSKREWFAGQLAANPAVFEMAKDPFWANLFFTGKVVPHKGTLAALIVHLADAMIEAGKEAQCFAQLQSKDQKP